MRQITLELGLVSKVQRGAKRCQDLLGGAKQTRRQRWSTQPPQRAGQSCQRMGCIPQAIDLLLDCERLLEAPHRAAEIAAMRVDVAKILEQHAAAPGVAPLPCEVKRLTIQWLSRRVVALCTCNLAQHRQCSHEQGCVPGGLRQVATLLQQLACFVILSLTAG